MMHSCPVGPCDLPVPDDKLMCRGHWYMVPPALQTEVWRAFHAHQAHKEDRHRLEQLRTAQAAAVRAVEEKLEATMQPRSA